mgnify:FL=1
MNIQKLIETTLNNFLNEASFYNINDEDILTDKYIKNFINDGSAEGLLDWYIEQNDLDDQNEYDIKNTPEFYNFIKNYLEEQLEEAKNNIENEIDYNTNKIKLYRKITVDDNWLNHLKTQGKRLGIYWSWDKRMADTYWGDYNKKNVATIEIEIHEKYIDWITTLEMNMNPFYTEEREIRLFKNTPIKIKALSINDEDVDISFLNDKTFFA